MGQSAPPLLSGDGRTMVLRALLARRRGELQIFRASAGMAGFAQQLSLELRELQHHQLSPDALRDLAGRAGLAEPLRRKLRDLALLLGDYLEWLRKHDLQDADCLPDLAADVLRRQTAPAISIAGLWLDGLAELTPQELSLLAALAPCCQKLTLAFCLGQEQTGTEAPSTSCHLLSGRPCCCRFHMPQPAPERRKGQSRDQRFHRAPGDLPLERLMLSCYLLPAKDNSQNIRIAGCEAGIYLRCIRRRCNMGNKLTEMQLVTGYQIQTFVLISMPASYCNFRSLKMCRVEIE